MTYQPGKHVKLRNPIYGTEREGVLIGERAVSGNYDTHTIRLPNGTLHRAEGVLLPA